MPDLVVTSWTLGVPKQRAHDVARRDRRAGVRRRQSTAASARDPETYDVHLETNLRSPMADFPISYAGDGRQYLAGSTGSAATATAFTLA